MALICGIAGRSSHKVISIELVIVALIPCHFLGVIQFSLVTGMGMGESFMLASAPYLIKDIISVIFAYVISLSIIKALVKTRTVSLK